MKIVDRILAWLYDRQGHRQNEQFRRLTSTNRKILALQAQQRRAVAQIRETNRVVRDHRGKF